MASPTAGSVVREKRHITRWGDALMQQTISREERKVRDHPRPNTEPSGGGFSAKRISAESHLHSSAQASGSFPGVLYERFLQLPVGVVLIMLWLIGVALLGSCVLVLYALATLLLA